MIITRGYMYPLDIFVQWVIQNQTGATKHNQTKELQVDQYPGPGEGLWVDLALLTVFFTFEVSRRILTSGPNLGAEVGLGWN